MNMHAQLATFGHELLKHNAIESALPLISEYAKETVGAQRCSIYIYDESKKELWTTLADGIEKVTLSSEVGIAGKTARTAQNIIENDPYSSPDFFQNIDAQSGYTTENIASIPVINSAHHVIGVLQLLNKEGGFLQKDIRFMIFFAHYISGYLELSTFFGKEQ